MNLIASLPFKAVNEKKNFPFSNLSTHSVTKENSFNFTVFISPILVNVSEKIVKKYFLWVRDNENHLTEIADLFCHSNKVERRENTEKIEGIDNINANTEIKEHSSRSFILLPRLDFKMNFEINFHEIALYVRLCDKNVNLIQNSLFVLAVRAIKVRACSSAYENKKMSTIFREKSRKFVDGNSPIN